MCKSICNIIVTTLFAIVWIILFGGSFILQPPLRGFDCRNIELWYPLHPVPTVGPLLLIFLSFFLPSLLVIVVDVWNYPRTNKPPGFKKKAFICRMLITIGKFVMAQVILLTLGNVVKAFAGEMRPCFMAACKPNVNCTDPEVFGHFVSNYKCTNKDRWAKQSRLTFPSGHSYSTAMAMTFIACYVDTQLKVQNFILGKIFLQYIFSFITVFVAVSRVVDFHHRRVDVTVGMIIGVAAGFTHSYFTGLFEPPHEEKIVEEPPQDVA